MAAQPQSADAKHRHHHEYDARTPTIPDYEDLIEKLKRYMPQLKASVKDLQNPSQSFVTKFYAAVLNEFFCEINNLIKAQAYKAQCLSYSKMYGEIILFMNMYTALGYIYSRFGVDDFVLNDICDPDPTRIYNLFQAMIEFMKFNVEKVNKVDAKKKNVGNIKEALDEFQNYVILNSINEKSFEHLQEEVVLILSDDVKSGKSELMAINKQKNELLNELIKNKQEQEEIEKKFFKLNELKEKLLIDIEDHNKKIVEEPNSSKAGYENLMRLKNLISEKISTMIAQLNLKNQTVVLLEQELVEQEKQLHLLKDVKEKNDGKKIHELETKRQKKKKKKKMKKEELEKDSKKLKEQIDFVEREQADIKELMNIYFEKMDHEHVLSKSEYDALEKERDDISKQKNFKIETIELLENEMNKLNLRKSDFENNASLITDEFEIVRNKLNRVKQMFNS